MDERSAWVGDGPLKTFQMGAWARRALAYATQACGEIESGIDATPALSAADACVRADMGELPEDEMADLGGPEMHELPEWMAAQAGFRQMFGLD